MQLLHETMSIDIQKVGLLCNKMYSLRSFHKSQKHKNVMPLNMTIRA